MSAVGGLLAVGHGALLQATGSLAGALAGSAEPSPSPSVQEIPPEDQTSPGFLGFIVTFAVAVVVILLAFSLVRHLRVAEHNARRLEAEQDGAEVAPPAHAARTGDPAAALAAAESGSPAAEEPGVLDPDDDGVLPSDPAGTTAPGPTPSRSADAPGLDALGLDAPGVDTPRPDGPAGGER